MCTQVLPGKALLRDAVGTCTHVPRCMRLPSGSASQQEAVGTLKQNKQNVIKGPFTKVRVG